MTSSASINQSSQPSLSQELLTAGVTASAPPAIGATPSSLLVTNVWGTHASDEPQTLNYAPNVEEFPAIGGQRPKKMKSQEGRGGPPSAVAVASTDSPPQRIRRRGPQISTPVLGNFLPDAVRPSTNTKQLAVGEWLKSVREESQAKGGSKMQPQLQCQTKTSVAGSDAQNQEDQLKMPPPAPLVHYGGGDGTPNLGPAPARPRRRNRRSQRHSRQQPVTTLSSQEPLPRALTHIRPVSAVASPPVPLQKDIASRSRLNSNALEFQPNLKRAAKPLNHEAAEFYPQTRAPPAPRQPTTVIPYKNKITSRRRHQRFARSLRPDSLFELVVPLPEPERAPNYGLIPHQGQAPPNMLPFYSYSAPVGPNQVPPDPPVADPAALNAHNLIWTPTQLSLPLQQHNSQVSQSVFRLASLPSTGVGTTHRHPDTVEQSPSLHSLPSTIYGPSEEDVEEGANELSFSHQDLIFSRVLQDAELDGSPPQSQFRGEEVGQVDGDDVEDLDCTDFFSDSDAPSQSHPPQPRHLLFGRGLTTAKSEADLSLMPLSIRNLYRLICSRNSDYAFVYTLSAQLCEDCVPMECYVYLKMALLASLASMDLDEVRAPIAMCVICSDSYMANCLLTSVAQLAPRFVGPHEGSGLHLAHTALPARFQWVVASPLLMAQQGVYYVGDWTRLSREHSDELEKCIEMGTVPVPQLQSEQPLEAAIWTYWQPEHSSNQTVSFAKFCPIFGLPIYMGDQEPSDVLWNFLLRQYGEHTTKPTQDALNINDEDMRQMLTLLHERKVNFSDAAEHLLQKYYVISRKERPTVFSSKTYIVLKQFAESFAKLAMRLDVLEPDVTVAIFHCEHFVQRICGASERPPPVVSNLNVISKVDAYMNEFARWLFHYLDRYDDKDLGTQPSSKRRRCNSLDMD